MVFTHKEDKLIGKNNPLDWRHGVEGSSWTQEKGGENKESSEKRSAFSHYENSFFEHLEHDFQKSY